MLYIEIFLTFFKIGLFSIGGGLATLPYLQELIDKKAWINSKELLNMIAISESTPGPIGINVATYIGHNTLGIFGGIVSTLGLITPSIIIIIIIAHYFAKFSEEDLVKSAFTGIRPAVTGLIAAAGFNVASIALLKTGAIGSLINKIHIGGLLLFIFMVFVIYKYKKHPLLYILFAALIGLIFKF